MSRSSVCGVNPGGALLALRQEYGIVASVTPYRESYPRFGPSIVTSPDQVDAAIRAVAEM